MWGILTITVAYAFSDIPSPLNIVDTFLRRFGTNWIYVILLVPSIYYDLFLRLGERPQLQIFRITDSIFRSVVVYFGVAFIFWASVFSLGQSLRVLWWPDPVQMIGFSVLVASGFVLVMDIKIAPAIRKRQPKVV